MQTDLDEVDTPTDHPLEAATGGVSGERLKQEPLSLAEESKPAIQSDPQSHFTQSAAETVLLHGGCSDCAATQDVTQSYRSSHSPTEAVLAASAQPLLLGSQLKPHRNRRRSARKHQPSLPAAPPEEDSSLPPHLRRERELSVSPPVVVSPFTNCPSTPNYTRRPYD
ncbi:hypothetical protein AOLI_G00039020 [Acnodon oligacanthus]